MPCHTVCLIVAHILSNQRAVIWYKTLPYSGPNPQQRIRVGLYNDGSKVINSLFFVVLYCVVVVLYCIIVVFYYVVVVLYYVVEVLYYVAEALY